MIVFLNKVAAACAEIRIRQVIVRGVVFFHGGGHDAIVLDIKAFVGVICEGNEVLFIRGDRGGEDVLIELVVVLKDLFDLLRGELLLVSIQVGHELIIIVEGHRYIIGCTFLTRRGHANLTVRCNSLGLQLSTLVFVI